MSMTLRVVPVTSPEDWAAYHDIRRSVLFDARGLEGYDPDHPDDRRDGHFPLLLKGTAVVGAARLDLKNGDRAIVRTVAIRPNRQRQGLGRELMSGIESFARERGVQLLTVHAARDAVEFYRRCGWVMVDEAKPEPILAKRL